MKKLQYLLLPLILLSMINADRGPIMILIGDFNGNDTEVTLEEYLFANNGKQRVYPFQFYELSFEERVDSLQKLDLEIKLFSRSTDVPSLEIPWPCIGIYHMRNLGDIDSIPGDEIGLVPTLPDFSNLNTYHIFSLRNGQWKEIYNFPVNEMSYSFVYPEETTAMRPVVKDSTGAIIISTLDEEGISVKRRIHL